MGEYMDSPQPKTPPIPLALSPVHAGFPSPAGDYTEQTLDLNELVISNPTATFYVRVAGDSMKDACIEEGDILVVDRSLHAAPNAIVIALLTGAFTVKRLDLPGKHVFLLPANRLYKPLKVSEHLEFQVWGVVTYCIRKVR
jgi:DNA polymerase V